MTTAAMYHAWTLERQLGYDALTCIASTGVLLDELFVGGEGRWSVKRACRPGRKSRCGIITAFAERKSERERKRRLWKDMQAGIRLKTGQGPAEWGRGAAGWEPHVSF